MLTLALSKILNKDHICGYHPNDQKYIDQITKNTHNPNKPQRNLKGQRHNTLISGPNYNTCRKLEGQYCIVWNTKGGWQNTLEQGCATVYRTLRKLGSRYRVKAIRDAETRDSRHTARHASGTPADHSAHMVFEWHPIQNMTKSAKETKQNPPEPTYPKVWPQ